MKNKKLVKFKHNIRFVIDHNENVHILVHNLDNNDLAEKTVPYLMDIQKRSTPGIFEPGTWDLNYTMFGRKSGILFSKIS